MLLLSHFPISRCWSRLPGVLLCTLALAGCGKDKPAAPAVAGGDPKQGQQLIAQYQCAACHQIPGVDWPQGTVGGSLDGFADRSMIAGRFPNQPDTLATWVRDAPSMSATTGMPAMPMTTAEARDVAAYLYTLEHD